MRKPVLFFLILILMATCKDTINPISPVPDVQVREELNLNSIAAQPLKIRDGNFIYIQGGIKGIIVYRKTQDIYLAFERQSPYKMDDPCGILTVPSSQFFMEDTCHKCSFSWDGKPISGPCRDVLKPYSVNYINATTLLITNP